MGVVVTSEGVTVGGGHSHGDSGILVWGESVTVQYGGKYGGTWLVLSFAEITCSFR